MQYEDYDFVMRNRPHGGIGLDVGSCNRNGSMRDELAWPDLVGVDVQRQHGYVDVVADAEHLPFRDGSFSFVSCLSVLEHSGNPLRVLDEINRVKDHDATVLISVPTRDFPNHFESDNWRISENGNPNYPCLLITNAPRDGAYRRYPLGYFLRMQARLLRLLAFDIMKRLSR